MPDAVRKLATKKTLQFGAVAASYSLGEAVGPTGAMAEDRCHHLSSFLPRTHPSVVMISVAIEYQIITKSGLSSVQYAA